MRGENSARNRDENSNGGREVGSCQSLVAGGWSLVVKGQEARPPPPRHTAKGSLREMTGLRLTSPLKGAKFLLRQVFCEAVT